MTLVNPISGKEFKLRADSRPPYDVATDDGEQEVRSLQVPAEMGRLWNDLEKAEALANQLIERLEHVLRIKEEPVYEEPDQIALVGLAEVIRERRLLFGRGVIGKLEYILNHLEI